MKQKLSALLATLGMMIALPSLAANHPATKDQIIMYASPQSNAIVEQLPANAPLVPIYREKAWVKVGDPRNGKVGWVNRKQVRKAREAFYRPDIQTVYISADQSTKGKPQLNIVAYKNGKKLSPEQAKRLYEKMRHQQERQMMNMRQAFNRMPMFFQPMIVLPAPQQPAPANRMQQKDPNAKHKTELET